MVCCTLALHLTTKHQSKSSKYHHKQNSLSTHNSLNGFVSGQCVITANITITPAKLKLNSGDVLWPPIFLAPHSQSSTRRIYTIFFLVRIAQQTSGKQGSLIPIRQNVVDSIKCTNLEQNRQVFEVFLVPLVKRR